METRNALKEESFDASSLTNFENLTLPTPLTEERLPFKIKIAQTEDDLEKAIDIRRSAYARHVPDLADLLREPEDFDRDEGSVILLAESKLDGTTLGSMRIQTNRFQPLKLEASVILPPWLQHQPLSEAARLGVAGNRMGKITKILLFKSYFLYCVKERLDWMVITARSHVDKDYENLMFSDVFPESGYIPMKHDANIPHRVMAFHVPSAESRWRAVNHPLYNLVFMTQHPDIDLSQTESQFHMHKIPHSTTARLPVMM